MRARDIREMAGEEPIPMVTAYDAPTAAIAESVGIDLLLVGDSVGNLRLGYESTLPVTHEEMASHTAAVTRGAEDAFIVADMPFLSYGADIDDAIEQCGVMVKDAGADAVKLESGEHTVELTDRLTDIGVPVQAHLGLTPQRENETGLYRQATSKEEARTLLDLAHRHRRAGAFSIVLEHVPANVAERVTEEVDVPTIGIGAGPDCDGQVLTVDEIIGLADETAPFSRSFGDVRAEMIDALGSFREAVADGTFPGDDHAHYQEDIDEFY